MGGNIIRNKDGLEERQKQERRNEQMAEQDAVPHSPGKTTPAVSLATAAPAPTRLWRARE